MNEDKAARYHRLDRRVRGAALVWSAGLLIALLVSPLSMRMREAATSAVTSLGVSDTFSPPVIVSLYVLILAMLHESVSLPLAYYRGHLLESRYNLSTQTVARWWRTHLKATIVGLLFAQAATGILYAAIREQPEWWWAVVALVFSLLTVWLARVGPVLLMPIFYQFKRIEREALQERLTGLARKAGAPVLGVYGWTLSDSTRKANAALVGLGRTRRILLSDTLLSDYSDDEVEVVLAHELAHHVHRDIWRGLAFDTVLSFAAFYIAHRALLAVGPWLRIWDPADIAALPLVLLVLGAVSLAAMPLANARSREHERRADRFALALTGNPAAFRSAMRRLAQQNLAEERPSHLAQVLFYSHPPIAERLQIAQE